MDHKKYRALVIGGSAGSLDALLRLFAVVTSCRLPILICVHLHPKDEGGLAGFFGSKTKMPVKEVIDKQSIENGTIHISPANYHLLVERDCTLSLSVDRKVNFSRPSIDVLFDSAAAAWGEDLIGIILTGASVDGAAGVHSIKQFGGLTIAQDPGEAEHPFMPSAAIATGSVDKILTITEIAEFLLAFSDRTGRQ